MGNIESIGVVVFLAGKTRIACPHSRFLIHPLNCTFSAGTIDHSRLREQVGTLDDDVERYAQIFDEATKGANKPLKVRTHLSSQEKIVAAADALSCGIVSRVEQASIPKGAVDWWVTGIS